MVDPTKSAIQKLKYNTMPTAALGLAYVTVFLFFACCCNRQFLFIHSFIADIYIAPLQVGLLCGIIRQSVLEDNGV